jgi:hypothetical protein
MDLGLSNGNCPNQTLTASPFCGVFQVDGSGQEFADLDIVVNPSGFCRSVLDAPPPFLFQLPSTLLVPSCSAHGKRAAVTFC